MFALIFHRYNAIFLHFAWIVREGENSERSFPFAGRWKRIPVAESRERIIADGATRTRNGYLFAASGLHTPRATRSLIVIHRHWSNCSQYRQPSTENLHYFTIVVRQSSARIDLNEHVFYSNVRARVTSRYYVINCTNIRLLFLRGEGHHESFREMPVSFAQSSSDIKIFH